jgi:DNA-binding NtrC family response regulator
VCGLENTIHRALLLAADGRLALRSADGSAPDEPGPSTALYGGGLRAACARSRWDTEERYLRELLALTGGNVSEAVRRAGTERRAMGQMLKRHGIGRQ